VSAIRLLVALGGTILIVFAFSWAMQVLTVKNADPPLLARLVFRGVRSVMYALGNLITLQQHRQRIWSLYVSVSLLAIVAIAIAQILIGYALVFYGISNDSLHMSYVNSVSSLSVLGFGGLPGTLAQSTLALGEAFTGPIFVALLITYLAGIASSVSQRQAQLRTIDVKLGGAHSGPDLLERALAGPGLPALTAIWQDWTQEFVLGKAAFPTVEGYLLIYSPGMHDQWVADAEAVLDAASLRNSAFDLPGDPDAARCLEEGSAMLKEAVDRSDHALLRFRHSHSSQEVSRAQFERACDGLAKAGASIVADRDTAWATFAADRAMYEDSINRLSQLMNMPLANWP
jgi:hypothetical protein